MVISAFNKDTEFNIINYYGNANQIRVRYHFLLTRIAKVKKTIINVKDVEKLRPSRITNGNVKWCSHFGRQFGSSSKYETLSYHMTGQSNSTPGCSTKRNETLCPHKTLYTNVYTSIIPKSQKMETTQVSIH